MESSKATLYDEQALGGRDTVFGMLHDEAHQIAELRDIFRATIETERRKLVDWLNALQSDGNVHVEDAADTARMLINAALDHSADHLDAAENASSPVSYIQHCISFFHAESRRRPIADRAASDVSVASRL